MKIILFHTESKTKKSDAKYLMFKVRGLLKSGKILILRDKLYVSRDNAREDILKRRHKKEIDSFYR
jgi:tartrate dehydratase beta subunit/fumarate hydratase class I family protein